MIIVISEKRFMFGCIGGMKYSEWSCRRHSVFGGESTCGGNPRNPVDTIIVVGGPPRCKSVGCRFDHTVCYCVSYCGCLDNRSEKPVYPILFPVANKPRIAQVE